MKCAVIGAGPMGLMTALRLAQAGSDVTVFEADDRIGGMSASFDFDGVQIERYYHFVCKTDFPLFNLLKELNLEDELVWKNTKMAFHFEGKLYPWGTPQALLSFPKLSFISKIRYALHVLYTKRLTDWSKLDKQFAHTWIRKWIGVEAFNVLWHPLFYYKFYEHAEKLSAAWIATRIKRVALSRKNMFQEELGYLKGGSERLLAEMNDLIKSSGGTIRLRAPVQEVVTESGKIVGVRSAQGFEYFDGVVSTVPLPYVTRLVPTLPKDEQTKIDDIKNVAVACVVLKMSAPFTDNFWTNINHAAVQIPGFIEYTNLNPLTQDGKSVHLFYAPYYMPKTHPKYSRAPEEFIAETVSAMKMIKPSFSEDQILSARTHKYEFSQTVCTPDFYQKLPAMESKIQGLFYADTSYYYPEDRSTSESIAVGEKLANEVITKLGVRDGFLRRDQAKVA